MKLLSGLASFFLNESAEPYVRVAEVEYSSEFRRFVRATGRRPTNEEAKNIILG